MGALRRGDRNIPTSVVSIVSVLSSANCSLLTVNSLLSPHLLIDP